MSTQSDTAMYPTVGSKACPFALNTSGEPLLERNPSGEEPFWSGAPDTLTIGAEPHLGRSQCGILGKDVSDLLECPSYAS